MTWLESALMGRRRYWRISAPLERGTPLFVDSADPFRRILPGFVAFHGKLNFRVEYRVASGKRPVTGRLCRETRQIRCSHAALCLLKKLFMKLFFSLFHSLFFRLFPSFPLFSSLFHSLSLFLSFSPFSWVPFFPFFSLSLSLSFSFFLSLFLSFSL